MPKSLTSWELIARLGALAALLIALSDLYDRFEIRRRADTLEQTNDFLHSKQWRTWAASQPALASGGATGSSEQ